MGVVALIELIAVPFDGYGRPGHQARAASVLHQVGLVGALSPHRVVEGEDLLLPPGDPARGADTSLINQTALIAMTSRLGDRVARAVAEQRFPFVYGGDCSTLLGTVPGLRRTGTVGLLFVDGHEDTMPLDVSEDGEAANVELGLLLGITGHLVSGPLALHVGALEKDQVAVLGPRDVAWRQRFNVGSLRDAGVWMRDWQEVAARPEKQAEAAVAHLKRVCDRWWLHVDLDVLDPLEFPAQGLPDVADDPDGLVVGRADQPADRGRGRGRMPRVEPRDLRPGSGPGPHIGSEDHRPGQGGRLLAARHCDFPALTRRAAPSARRVCAASRTVIGPSGSWRVGGSGRGTCGVGWADQGVGLPAGRRRLG